MGHIDFASAIESRFTVLLVVMIVMVNGTGVNSGNEGTVGSLS